MRHFDPSLPRLAGSCLLALASFCGTGAAGDPPAPWSQFRGPGGSGIAPDATPPIAVDPERNLRWSCAVPLGHSSPCVIADRLFITGSSDAGKRLETLCIDRATGAVRWRRVIEVAAPEKIHDVNSLASPTPASDGRWVVVYFGSYGLVCYDVDGEVAWQRPLANPDNTFGSAASPILHAGHVLFCCDQRADSYLCAIDLATGETVWRTERAGFGSGWSTPTVWHNGDVEELVVYGVWWLTAYDVRDGRQRWSVPGLADEPIVTPVAGDGRLYVTSYNMRTSPEVIGLPTFDQVLKECDVDGDGRLTREEAANNRSVLSRADADGEGDHPLRIFFRFLDVDTDGAIEAEEWPKLIDWVGSFKQANGIIAIRPGDAEHPAEIEWQESRGVPECPSPLFLDGLIYAVKNGGVVACLDAATGTTHYRARLDDAGGPYYASPVAAAGRIYLASAHGVISVIAAGPELMVLAQNDLGMRIQSTPAIVGDTIYIRTEAQVLAFQAKD